MKLEINEFTKRFTAIQVNYSPARWLEWDVSTEISELPQKGGRGLQWMRNATLIPHMPVAIAMTIFFPFQIATLMVALSTLFCWIAKSVNWTYMRSTIKREAAATVKYAEI
jgi:hypothetical protein